jgi:hypothetical protein
MKCSETKDLLSTYYDNELSVEMRTSVDAHVGECPECKTELESFKSLSSLTAGLDQPETPVSVWTAVERSLGEQNIDDNSSDKVSPVIRSSVGYSGKRFLQMAAAIAATLLIGFVGWTLWHGDHEHAEMVKAMEQVASEINLDSSNNLLLRKFGGSEVTYQQAITQVGYRPVATKGLPEGYSVESVQVLDMPCCKCTQTACRRPDNSRFFIYEHDNEETGWFEHRNKRQCQCGGNDCEVVELDDQLAATWEKDDRHITLLGVRDEQEIELLAKHFDESS